MRTRRVRGWAVLAVGLSFPFAALCTSGRIAVLLSFFFLFFVSMVQIDLCAQDQRHEKRRPSIATIGQHSTLQDILVIVVLITTGFPLDSDVDTPCVRDEQHFRFD